MCPWTQVHAVSRARGEAPLFDLLQVILLQVILFILAGTGLALVVVAAGLWIARRARDGKEGDDKSGGSG
ncbi:MAG: hypothetical protein ACE5JE_04720 [Thermoplasmata archaeon]